MFCVRFELAHEIAGKITLPTVLGTSAEFNGRAGHSEMRKTTLTKS